MACSKEKYTILFSDEEVVVCDKAAGLLSQPDEKGGENLLDLLKAEFPSKEVGLVHRLDRGVGGVMVYALGGRALSFLNKEIQEGRFKKTYLAVVHGELSGGGRMKDFLFKDKTKNKSYVVKTERKGAKEAILDYKVLSVEGGKTLLEIELKTGRFHQIRCQLSSRQLPIVGDGKYGSKENTPIALYCKGISFVHPATKKVMTFEAEKRESYPFDLFKGVL